MSCLKESRLLFDFIKVEIVVDIEITVSDFCFLPSLFSSSSFLSEFFGKTSLFLAIK
jgi:hypothetical protein